MRRSLWFAAGCWLVAATVHSAVSLPKIIGDHMVLQQGLAAPIWGHAAPGELVSVRADALPPVQTTTDKNGNWRVDLPLPAAGGPHTITIAGENKIVLQDVLIGEVWVCSGQSNMEMPVGDYGGGYSGATNWQEELRQADWPEIRLFTVPNRHSLTPQFDCEGAWVVCHAETAKAFSAAGFFFGRELHQTLKVPVALISADYGGTVAEAWTSQETMATFPEFADQLKMLTQEQAAANAAAAARAEAWSNWLAQVEAADGGATLAAAQEPDSGWSAAPKLGPWTGSLANFAGYVWFRKPVMLPTNWGGREMVLELGPVDDMDFTYVNGTKIGQTVGEGTWSLPRRYPLPQNLLQPGTNLIAVRVLNLSGHGGITGPACLALADGSESIPLDAAWQFRQGAPMNALPPLNLPAVVNPNTATVLYNGMIAPLVPFGIRGAIWYQGESNIGRDAQYRRLFPALIADWRRHWGEGDFPFYYTQIAPFHYPNPGQAAALREAQRLALKTPHTGMAVTMDSDSNNLHPHTKQAVGHRLALWALAKTYGRTELTYSGPLFRQMIVEGSQARLYFDQVGSGLTAGGQSLQHFEMAGADRVFQPAHAEIDGATIVVSAATVTHPVAVRYAWGDGDESSFGNREGLPAASFSTALPEP